MLGDRDVGLQDDGSHLEPESWLALLISPSYSDISLSDVGSHFTFFENVVFFWGAACVVLEVVGFVVS